MTTQNRHQQKEINKKERIEIVSSEINSTKQSIAELENQLSLLRKELDKQESKRLSIILE